MGMSRRVILDLPDSVYERARQEAAQQGRTVETVLTEALTEMYQSPHNDLENKKLLAAAIEVAEWWNAEGDKEWDQWQP